jgi:hypothetical protein
VLSIAEILFGVGLKQQFEPIRDLQKANNALQASRDANSSSVL